MASIERTAYPRFTKRMSAEELCACYELSDAALDFVGANANGDRQRLTLAVLLKTRQQLGVYIRSNAISGDLKLNNANMGDLRIFDTPSNRSTWGQDIWGEDSVLDLAGAMVVSLDNDVELRSWPARISSLGFNFQRVVGRVAESEADRSIDWWNEWLKRVTYGYSGTAKAAAKSLRDAGEPDSADDLLYDYRVREQQPLAGSVMLG